MKASVWLNDGKHSICHMKMEKLIDKEKEDGKKTAWIPFVNPTYQVISVLLQCLTAEKSHKTRGGWGRDNTERLLFPQIKQR